MTSYNRSWRCNVVVPFARSKLRRPHAPRWRFGEEEGGGKVGGMDQSSPFLALPFGFQTLLI